jgi:hypothetical protein
MTKIDCLVCHDTTGTYKKTPTAAGMPDPKVDLVAVAKSVGPTSRKTCGDCHFNGGGGEAVKHADLSRQLLHPERNCDVHMGGYDFQCTECHRTRNHKIAGRSSSVPVAEGASPARTATRRPTTATTCWTTISTSTATTSPAPPAMRRSTPNANPPRPSGTGPRPATKPASQKRQIRHGDYHWKKGEFIWKESAKPVYRWYGGFHQTGAAGRPAGPDPARDQHHRTGGLHQRSQLQDRAVQDHGRGPGRGCRVQAPAGAPPVSPRQGRQDRLLETPRLAEGLHRRE